jgi:hypothetical protein
MAWSMGLSLAVQVLGTRTTSKYSGTGPLPGNAYWPNGLDRSRSRASQPLIERKGDQL